MTKKSRSKTRKPRKFDICGTGYIPCNKRQWRDAGLMLFRPGYGVVSVAFSNRYPKQDGALGIGGKEADDSTIVVHECPDGKVGYIGTEMADGKSWYGVCLWADRVLELGFYFKDYPGGDIRDMVDMALRHIGWPVDPKRYLLIGKSGEFWDKQYPMGYEP